MVFSPARPSRVTSSAFTEGGITDFSFCRPSRGPTSTILTTLDFLSAAVWRCRNAHLRFNSLAAWGRVARASMQAKFGWERNCSSQCYARRLASRFLWYLSLLQCTGKSKGSYCRLCWSGQLRVRTSQGINCEQLPTSAQSLNTPGVKTLFGAQTHPRPAPPRNPHLPALKYVNNNVQTASLLRALTSLRFVLWLA